MTRRTLMLLNRSIKHWERHANGKARLGESVFSDDCALCREFCSETNSDDSNCDGCPVKAKTGQSMCRGTPWKKAQLAWWSLCGTANYSSKYRANAKREFQKAAVVMVKFLKSLRPRRKEKP